MRKWLARLLGFDELLAEKDRTIEAQRTAIQALQDMTSALRVQWGFLTPPPSQQTEQNRAARGPYIMGRSGWRGQAAEASAATVPVPSDSAMALQKRVEDSGGK